MELGRPGHIGGHVVQNVMVDTPLVTEPVTTLYLSMVDYLVWEMILSTEVVTFRNVTVCRHIYKVSVANSVWSAGVFTYI